LNNKSESPSAALAFARSAGRFLGASAAVLAAAGAYDVARNRNLDESVVKRYFVGNGILTWVLSPLNALFDLLSLPYVNKGIYKLEDLPKPYQEEIQSLIDAAVSEDLVGKLESTAEARSRTMAFFKWYGSNVNTVVDIPAFHKPYKYIKTIGVSVFNKKQSTSKHFGPLRPTLRVLYNINQMHDKLAYIEVGDVKHYWQDDKLFIFDDTLMHQSFNETEQARYCLFVDILRPSRIPGVFAAIVDAVQFCLRGVNYMFYKNWDVVKG
jgi:hypothetical protein